MVAGTPYPSERTDSDPSSTEIESHLYRSRIVIIDSNQTYRAILADYLREHGFLVVEYANPNDSIDWLIEDRKAAALLIEDDRPGQIWIGFVVRIRTLGIRTPVALVASSYDQRKEELALKAGASDYFSRTRSLSIVASRLGLLANGSKLCPPQEVGEGEVFELDDLKLRIHCHRAYWENESVPLTVTEFRIVHALAVHIGNLVSYRDVYDLVHGTGFSAGYGPTGVRCNVRSLIRGIRVKFRKLDESFSRIENQAGQGYKLWVGSGRRLPGRTRCQDAAPCGLMGESDGY